MPQTFVMIERLLIIKGRLGFLVTSKKHSPNMETILDLESKVLGNVISEFGFNQTALLSGSTTLYI